jgi:hypothetical protein
MRTQHAWRGGHGYTATCKAYAVLNEKAKKRTYDKELAEGRVAELNDEASHLRANDQEMEWQRGHSRLPNSASRLGLES